MGYAYTLGKGKTGGCFICGGAHWARNRPDKTAPWSAKGKGKGKSMHMLGGLEMFDDGLKQDMTKEAMTHEQEETTSATASTSARRTGHECPAGHGLGDTGASASAGSEAAVRRLIASIVAADPTVQVLINSSEKYKPWFRYG